MFPSEISDIYLPTIVYYASSYIKFLAKSMTLNKYNAVYTHYLNRTCVGRSYDNLMSYMYFQFRLCFHKNTEAYLDPIRLAKIVNDLSRLTIFAKKLHHRCWTGS